jgi:TRAP-type C4-dicarboxylate transport system permease large subunit
MTGHEISYTARTAVPFFCLMCVMVVLLVAFPELANWLPETMREHPG